MTAQHSSSTSSKPGTRTGGGLLLALVAAAAFGSSGVFATSLLDAGWTPGSAVFVRILGAAVLLAVPAALALRGRWSLLRAAWRQVLLYGALAVALPQAAFFFAVEHLAVGVALLLEYLGLVLVVCWVSITRRRRPTRATTLGVLLALAGLVLVLDLPAVLGAGAPFSAVGVAWGLLAAVGLASFFVMSSATEVSGGEALPPLALAGGGLVVAAALFGLLGLLGVLPMSFATDDVQLAGTAFPWWVPVLELGLVAAATAYVAGIAAARLLGATVASFVGLAEVVFAVVFAWLLLAQLPSTTQLAGGVVLLAGVVVARLEQVRGEGGDAPGAVAGTAPEEPGTGVRLVA